MLLCTGRKLWYYPAFLVAALCFNFPGSAQVSSTMPGKTEHYTYTVLNRQLPRLVQTDTHQVSLTLERAGKLLKNAPDSAISISSLALQQSMRLKFNPGVSNALNLLGLGLQQKGLLDSAASCFKMAISYAGTGHNYDHLYKLYHNLGNINFNIGKYELYLENNYLALELLSKGNKGISTKDTIALYANMGYVWAKLGVAEQALTMLKVAETIARRTNDTLLLIKTLAREGTAYLVQDSLAKGETILLESLRMAKQHQYHGSSIEILNELGHFYIDVKNPGKAWLYTLEATSILARFPESYQYDRLHTFHNLGKLYLDQKEYAKALAILKSTFQKAMDMQQKDMIPHMEADVAEAYAVNGHYPEAFTHMQHYAQLIDTIYKQEKTNALQAWMKSRIAEKDRAMVAQQLRIARQQNELQVKNFWIGSTILGALLLAGCCIIWIRSFRNKQKLQQSALLQLQQEQEINQLKAQVRGEEQERNRIAQELHDGIASQLWAIKLNVDSLQQQVIHIPDRKSLQAIYAQLNDTTQEVRKTAHNLMPDLLLQEGLATAIASLCEKTQRNTKVEVDFLEFGVIPRMHEEIELSIYRMIQELIQNVLKHGRGANQLLVQLSCIDTLLNITVEDNGAGFEPGQAPDQGIGLYHIQKRVRAMQGHIDIQSTIGKGTTVYLEFDIQYLT